MKLFRLLLLSVMFSGIAALGQNSTPTQAADGLELLKRVSQHYADAKTYDIQSIEESTYSSKLQRQWRKTMLEAAEAPGGRFHYDGDGEFGSAVQISDGKIVWTYDANGPAYTEKAATLKPPANRIIGITEGSTTLRAKALRRELASFADRYKSATLLPNESIEVDGKRFHCYVIRVTHSDRKRDDGSYYEETIWIDQASNVFVKRESQSDAWFFGGPYRVKQDSQTTIVYPLTKLDAPIDASLFVFNAPKDAKLIEEFPSLMLNGLPSLTGQMLPNLKFVTVKGSNLAPEIFKGKVTVLDLWATWCAPCVSGLEQLSALYKEGRDKGLNLITIDQDEDAVTAAAMLSKKGYDWTNVHDSGEITKALGGTNGIPRTLVVDREGKVVYDRTAASDTELRKAIASLGPEFASLAPKEQPAPCATVAAAAH